jgi:hypothetical protein
MANLSRELSLCSTSPIVVVERSVTHPVQLAQRVNFLEGIARVLT